MSTTNIFKQFNNHIANLVKKPAVSATLVIVARLLASTIFIGAGLSKPVSYTHLTLPTILRV